MFGNFFLDKGLFSEIIKFLLSWSGFLFFLEYLDGMLVLLEKGSSEAVFEAIVFGFLDVGRLGQYTW